MNKKPLFEKIKNIVFIWELYRLIPGMKKITSLEDDISFHELIEECNYLTTSNIHENNNSL